MARQWRSKSSIRRRVAQKTLEAVPEGDSYIERFMANQSDAQRALFAKIQVLEAQHLDRLRDVSAEVAMPLSYMPTRRRNMVSAQRLIGEVLALYGPELRQSEEEICRRTFDEMSDLVGGNHELLLELPISPALRCLIYDHREDLSAAANVNLPDVEDQLREIRQAYINIEEPIHLWRLMQRMDYIKLETPQTGRCPQNVATKETVAGKAVQDCELVDVFLQLLDLKRVDDKQVGWTLLHYLADAVSWSKMATRALRFLLSHGVQYDQDPTLCT